jgi:GT2 family glycosyltransferase
MQVSLTGNKDNQFYRDGFYTARQDLKLAVESPSVLFDTCCPFKNYGGSKKRLIQLAIKDGLTASVSRYLCGIFGEKIVQQVWFYKGIKDGLGAIEALDFYSRNASRPTELETGLSIILCTRNRPDALRRCISTILEDPYPEFQLLIADQSDNPESEKVIAEFLTDSRVSYLPLKSRGKNRAINSVLPLTRYSLIGFIDDDCRPAPGWINSFLSIFNNRPEISVVVGEVLPAPYDPATGHIPHYLIPEPLFCGLKKLKEPGGCGMGANMAARREVYERVGPFDENIGPGTALPASDDFDFCYQAWRAGFLILLSPAPKIWHDGFRSGEALTKLVEGYRLSGSAVCMKHIRKGEISALFLLLAMLLDSLKYVIKRAVTGKRPYGFRGLIATLKGILVSFNPIENSVHFLTPPDIRK